MSQILLSLLRLADLVVSVTRALASGMRVNEILNTHTTMQDPGTAELAVNDAARRLSLSTSPSPTRMPAHRA